MKNTILRSLLIIIMIGCSQKRENDLSNTSEEIWLNPLDSMVYTWIPPGKMMIDAMEKVGEETRTIRKEVNIGHGFWMSKTEVTVRQFTAFINSTNYVTEAENAEHRFNWQSPGFDQEPDHPVVYVSINDMKQYMEWVGAEVPTQEEWIYATRAGTQTSYYWGDEFNEDYLWYRMNTSGGTQPVGTKLANNWGLHDMIGNVYEYVSVCNENYIVIGSSWTRCHRYSSHNRGDTVQLPLGKTGEFRLVDCTAGLINPWNDDTGFRCVKHNN
ncbi:formylglycine-generating enzyme family protein [Bacteroidota bacterium]